MNPEIGDIVIYQGIGEVFPAIVTGVKTEGYVSLFVFKTNDPFRYNVPFSESREQFTWRPKFQAAKVQLLGEVELKNLPKKSKNKR